MARLAPSVRAKTSMDNSSKDYGEFIKICTRWKWMVQNLDQVHRLDICSVKYQPLYASSYIPTPKEIAHPTKGIVNINNDDS